MRRDIAHVAVVARAAFLYYPQRPASRGAHAMPAAWRARTGQKSRGIGDPGRMNNIDVAFLFLA
ncbi:MAG TPA: hypothetical protein PKC03_11745, partial [Dokdonella sp.]|nr:hypothetical protein [Dokdonella sp.]